MTGVSLADLVSRTKRCRRAVCPMPRVLNYKRDGLPCSKWANPFKLRRGAGRKARDEVIARYERHLHDSGLGVLVRAGAAPRRCAAANANQPPDKLRRVRSNATARQFFG